jgi:hypothetical protein
MQKRLKGLQRIAVVYVAVKHAQSLALEQAAAALREAEERIAEQRAQAERSRVEGKAALDAGEHVDWQMHESQKQFTERNAATLMELRQRRETLMLEAAETYRAGRMQLEQMESVLRDLRSKAELQRAHIAQRESDDRFLSRQWWAAREGSVIEVIGEY